LSLIADAFEELLDAQEAALGSRPQVNIGGDDYDFLPEENNLTPIYAMGGTVESGGFAGLVRLSDFSGTPPAKYTACSYNGQSLVILNSKIINQTIYIQAGDADAD